MMHFQFVYENDSAKWSAQITAIDLNQSKIFNPGKARAFSKSRHGF